MNALQKIQFEMLGEFIKVCQKLELQYYMICGSALGSVKYKGFIPWDDDIDLALPRRDYDIFVKNAQELLPSYYFIQNYKTDKNYHLFCSKMRDSRTTYIERDQKNLNIHHGVFIDIIPLDTLPADKFFKIKYRIFRIHQLMYLQSSEKYKNMIKFIVKPFVNIRLVNSYFERYLRIQWVTEEIEYCNFHNAKRGQLYMEATKYGKGVLAKFEGIDVVVPEKYDEYLAAYYGDWRADLPDEQKVGHHYYEILDLEHPYTDYIEKIIHNGRGIKLKKLSSKL